MSLELIKLQRVVQEFRTLYADMPSSTMLAFIYIAQREETGADTTISDVGNFLGVSSASASRNTSMLGSTSWTKKTGVKLITAYENPNRKIEKFLTLTPEGKQLAQRIKEYMK